MADATPTTEQAIRAALARGGRVEIPPGTHEIRDTLVLTPGVTHFHGSGRDCVLLWKGPSDRAAIHTDAGVWHMEAGGFHLRNGGYAGGGIGLAACKRERPGNYVGTVCGSNRWSNVGVEGFDVGVCLGDAGYSCTSENRFTNLHSYGNRTAVFLTGYDTLNNHFTDLNTGDGSVGVRCQQGGGETRVHGGSASGMTGSVFDFVSGGTFTVRDYRQGEGGGGRFLGCGSPVQVEVTGCVIAGTGCEFPIDINYDSQVVVTGSTIDGRVVTNYLTGSVLLSHCQTTHPGPQIVDVRNKVKGGAYRVQEVGCVTRVDGRMVRLKDYTTNVTG